MRRSALAFATVLALAAAGLAAPACKGDDHPAAAPAPAPAPIPPSPIHVAPPANASAPSDPNADAEAMRRELDHLDSVMAHAQHALEDAHTDADRIKAKTLINATQRRRDELAARLKQPVPQ